MTPLASSPAAVAAVLAFLVWGTVLACRRTWLRHLGAALMVIVFGALLANVGVIATGGSSGPGTAGAAAVYSGVFAWVAPLSIFWLLLPVNLRSVLRAGGPMLFAFGVGVVGTVLGVLVGMQLIGGPELLGADYPAVSGMYAGTYTGGSVNFNAVALHYDIVERGGLYAGLVAADNIVTALWMVGCLALPRWLAKRWPTEVRGGPPTEASPPEEGPQTPDAPDAEDPETFDAADLGFALGLGLAAVAGANTLAAWCETQGFTVPSILIVSVLALLAAQHPRLAALRGARVLAMFSVYIFLAVIGAYCDLGALVELERIGPRMLALATTIIAVHAALSFGLGRLFKIDKDVVAVASQANIGGATTALAVARSLGRGDLVLPGILVGSVGTALGTFVGFWLAGVLG